MIPLHEYRLITKMKNLRKYQRTSCCESTFFTTRNMVFEGLIKNISPRGVFIESLLVLPVGQIITIAIPSNQKHKDTKVEGKVVWTNEDGFGVKLNEMIKL